MIVCPLFADQHDNAQRAVEMKIGAKFNPFTVTESELLTTIDRLMEDEEIKTKLNQISIQMQNSTAIEDVVKRIEKIAEN
ncbi:UDP-glycosyltransferase 203A3-like protein, partial [Dinothrombium tinctorium]